MATNSHDELTPPLWHRPGTKMDEERYHELERLSPDRKYEYSDGIAYMTRIPSRKSFWSASLRNMSKSGSAMNKILTILKPGSIATMDLVTPLICSVLMYTSRLQSCIEDWYSMTKTAS